MFLQAQAIPDPVIIPGMKYTFDIDNYRINLEWHIADQPAWRRVLEAIKNIPGRRYSSATKKWSVPNTKEMRDWCRASGWQVPEPEIVTRPPPPYIKERVLPGLYSYQEDFLKFSLTRPRLALFDEQGCIAGDMEVCVYRHKSNKRMTLARLYKKFHGTVDRMLHPHKTNPWFIHCIHADGRFRLGKIVDVIESGIKDCVSVSFDDGGELVLTPDHLMKTETGWIEASKSLGAEIVCNGPEECESEQVVFASHRLPVEEQYDLLLKSGDGIPHASGNPLNGNTLDVMLLDDREASDAFRNAITQKYFKPRRPRLHKVVSVTPVGRRMTYDVKVLNHANFLAGGVVVHNCGKTVQALSWVRYHGILPVLIIATASTKNQWANNYRMWLKRDDIEVLSGETPTPLVPGKSYIINWDILYKWERSPIKSNLHTHGFKALVCDEVQAIGNRTSQRTKAFLRLSAKIPCLLAMSGTPARSRPVQLWPVLHSIDPATFPDFYAYANRYCNPKVGPYGTEYKGISNGEELHALLSTRTLRRTKAEVMSFLPPKIITTVPCEVDPGMMAAYKEQARIAREASEFEKSAAIAGLFQSAYDMKAGFCKQWIMDFLSTDEKLLVFAWHHAVVDDIAGYLKSKGIGTCILTGTTSASQRESIKESFVHDPKIRVIVANIQSAGVGIDGLQKACSNCCFVEFTAAPTDHWQAEDRLHRGGQEVPVNVYYLVAPRTIDVTMAYQLDTKAKALASVLDGTDAHIVKIADMIRKKKP